jgi:hypothetical protein
MKMKILEMRRHNGAYFIAKYLCGCERTIRAHDLLTEKPSQAKCHCKARHLLLNLKESI